ncbi:hypothetical protein [Spirosoma litoris]
MIQALAILTIVTFVKQSVVAQGSISAALKKAAEDARAAANKAQCPEQKTYYLKLASYCDCTVKVYQTGSGVSQADCDRLKPTSSNPPCPNNSGSSNSSSNGGSYSTGASTYSPNADFDRKAKSFMTPQQQYEYDRLNDPISKTVVGGAAMLADVVNKAQQQKDAERESHRYGTSEDKESLMDEANQLRYQASGNARGLWLLVGGAAAGIGFLGIKNADEKVIEPSTWHYIAATGGIVIVTFGIIGIVRDISRKSRAKELEWQANHMQISFSPIINGYQYGQTYNGARLTMRF